jgi:MFS family permease
VPAIDHPDPKRLGLIVAGYTLGGLPGLFPASWVADNLGRRLALAIGCLIIVAGGLIQALTTGGWKMFAGRFVVGIGGSFCTISGSAYTAEIAHPRNRSQVGALINTCWCVRLGVNAVVKVPHVLSACALLWPAEASA